MRNADDWTITEILAYLGFLLLVSGLLIYAGFRFERWFHWKFAYQYDVQAKITEMVKEECLNGSQESP